MWIGISSTVVVVVVLLVVVVKVHRTKLTSLVDGFSFQQFFLPLFKLQSIKLGERQPDSKGFKPKRLVLMLPERTAPSPMYMLNATLIQLLLTFTLIQLKLGQ